MVEKSPDAFRTISEVANDLDVPQHVLRFWETRFSQVKPMKRGGGRRYYRPDDVELLRGIRHLLYGDGYTIKGVQRILRENGIRHVIGLGKSLHHDAVNGAGSEDEEAAGVSIPAVRLGESPSGAAPGSDKPAPTAEPPKATDINPSKPAPAAAIPSSDAEETIDFSASRSVLVRRRQRDADAAEAMPAASAAQVASTSSDAATETNADQPAEHVAPIPAGPAQVGSLDAGTADVLSAEPALPGGSPLHNEAVPSAATKAPSDPAEPKAGSIAATAGLDENDVIRLQAAVFELLECRRILSEQD